MRIVWAVDAFEDLAEVDLSVAQFTNEIAQRGEVELYPVYILSPDQLGIRQELQVQGAELYGANAKAMLLRRLENLRIPGLKPVEILTRRSHSRRASVALLCEFAERINADLIVSGTHGRKGMQRWMLGSFAEGLMAQSRVPILIIGARSTFTSGASKHHILLPTDLRDPRSNVFDSVFSLARRLRSRVTLLHAIPRPVEPVLQYGVVFSGSWTPLPKYLEREEARILEAAEQVQMRARGQDIECGLIIDLDCPSIVDSILRQAQERDNLVIAMESETGPIATSLAGSITRNIVREMRCPLYLVRHVLKE